MRGYLQAFTSLLTHRWVSRPVWTADVSYWLSARQTDGTADPAWGSEEGYLDLCMDLGIMPYYWYDRFWLAEDAYDDTVTLTTRRSGDITTQEWRTPVGHLVGEQTYLPSSYSTGHSRFSVQTVDDLEVLVWMVEHRALEPRCLEDYAERCEL